MKVVTSPLLESVAGIRHAFFTRHGGVSEGVYDSLNVGRGSNDEAADVTENRRRCAEHFGVEPRRLQTNYQVHSATAVLLEEDWHLDLDPNQADGLVTAMPNVVCGALSADCAPVLLVDPKARVVAALHAGWKGALDGITDFTLIAMMDEGAELKNICAAVGPCIGPQSYEVGLEYLDRFVAHDAANARFFQPGAADDKRLFDLPAYVLSRLTKAGVAKAEWTGHDTCADPDFFSNRRAFQRGESDYGRLLSAIMLTD